MYRVLYRKWRPQVFSDVVGQPHITETLTNEVRENRLSHAYLFTGSRGTGKTTCAKILSKAVNCLNPNDGNPCNQCEICKGIDNGSILDIVEIDAASNRGIDDIRALREEASFTPSNAKFRVYIIDEVHMLTIEAFNALLKILEEPPTHVKFILATTEVQKLPATILSRCQRFDFRRIPSEQIAKRLIYVAEQESAKLELDAALLIARIADGALRDALSLLDRCISTNTVITAKIVGDTAGILGSDYIISLSKAIHEKNPAAALVIIDDLHKASFESERLCYELINHFRNILVIKTVEIAEEFLICTPDDFKTLKALASDFSEPEVFNCLNVLSEALDKVKRSQNRRMETELAIIRLCSFEEGTDNDALVRRIIQLEKKLEEVEKRSLSNLPETLVKSTSQESQKENKATLLDNSKEKTTSPQKTAIVNETENSVGIDNSIQTFTDTSSVPVFDEEEALPLDENDSQTLPFSEQEDDNCLPFFEQQENFDVSLPFDAVDTKEKDNASASSNQTFKEWKRIVSEVERICPPFTGMFGASDCRIENDVLLIKANNPLPQRLCENQLFAQAIEKAIQNVTGKNHRFKLV